MQQIHPGREARRRQGRVVVLELIALAQLLGDGAPDAERRIALAPGERHHAHRPQLRLRRVEAAHHLGAELRMLGQKAEGKQIVGLAAAHRLREFEDALRRLAFDAPEALRQERAHPLGDVVLGEELGRVDAAGHQVAEVEDGIAKAGVEGAGARDAGLSDGLHGGGPTVAFGAIVAGARGRLAR